MLDLTEKKDVRPLLADLLAIPMPETKTTWREGLHEMFAALVCLNNAVERGEIKPYQFAVHQSHAEFIMLIQAMEQVMQGDSLEKKLDVKMEKSTSITLRDTLARTRLILDACAELLTEIDPHAMRIAHAHACTSADEAVSETALWLNVDRLERLPFVAHEVCEYYLGHELPAAMRRGAEGALGKGGRVL